MQLPHVNTNHLPISLDFTSLCPNKWNATCYDTWLKKTLFFTNGSIDPWADLLSYLIKVSLHIHVISEIRLNCPSHPPTSCPVRISNITSSIAVLVTKKDSLVLFHLSFIRGQSEQKKQHSQWFGYSNLSSDLYTCRQRCQGVLRNK